MDDYFNQGFMSMNEEWNNMLDDEESTFYIDPMCDSLDDLLD